MYTNIFQHISLYPNNKLNTRISNLPGKQIQKTNHMKTSAPLPSRKFSFFTALNTAPIKGVKFRINTYKNSFMKKFVLNFEILVIALLIVNLFFTIQSFGQGLQTFSTAGTSTFTVPPGVTSINVACWGGGGAGGGVTRDVRAGGGGEGGSFVRGTITVTPNATYTVVVGSGGTGSTGNGTSGEASSFGGSGLFNAIGGVWGAAGNDFGAGGSAANTGNIVSGTATSSYYGGNGGNGTNANTATSGGGGGSAGAGSAGGNGGTPTAGTAGAAGSPSAPGASGAIGRSTSNDGNGNTGNAPGGGGSGARNANDFTDYIGGAGGNGQVIVSWTCPAATISYPYPPSSSAFCKSITSVIPTFSGTTGGVFSSSAGLTINSSSGVINPSTSTPGTYTVHYQIASGGNGCTAVDVTASVKISAIPVATVANQKDITCFGDNDGTITVSASGSTSPYTFSVLEPASWQPATGTDLCLFEHLLPDVPYRIRVKDANGCLSK
jgi:hypothetical protein